VARHAHPHIRRVPYIAVAYDVPCVQKGSCSVVADCAPTLARGWPDPIGVRVRASIILIRVLINHSHGSYAHIRGELHRILAMIDYSQEVICANFNMLAYPLPLYSRLWRMNNARRYFSLLGYFMARLRYTDISLCTISGISCISALGRACWGLRAAWTQPSR
jgi:hypothetical protein